MRIGDGSLRQKTLLGLWVGIYLLGLGIAGYDKVVRVGAPDPGWKIEWRQVSPMREDAAVLGLRGGGRVLDVNGLPLEGRSLRDEIEPQIRRELGQTNTLRVVRPGGEVREVTVPVRRLTWGDVIYAEGATIALGMLFFAVGFGSFLLRPWEPSSWALLSLCTVAGGFLTTLFTDVGPQPYGELYFRAMLGLLAAVPLHAGLAFPVVHPWLLRRRHQILSAIYGLGIAHAVLQIIAWRTEWAGVFRYLGAVENALLLAAVFAFLARCLYFALRTQDPLVAQRARILLGGVLFGGALPVLVRFAQTGLGTLYIDPRFSYWTLSLLLIALARVTVRQDLLDARVAVRRAFIFGVVAVALTGLAIAVVSVSPYLVAALLLPLLYFWPQFSEWLDQRFYPNRARLGELVRTAGDEMAACTTYKELLEALANAVQQVFETQSAAVVLFPGAVDRDEHRVAAGDVDVRLGPPFHDEPLLQLLGTTRQEVFRNEIAVQAQYTNIREECYACLDRLGAELIVPISRGGRVIGCLAAGPQVSGDAWDALDLEVLRTLIQQGVQSVVRIEALDALRDRESEFADLKRFFPPQIIEQVMARGGAAELRSQRKPVTVLFADLRGFTAFSERAEPEEVMNTLADYHAAMGEQISKWGGTLERFVGDGFMVFFNDPVEQADHVERAARMSIDMRADIARLREDWDRRGYGIDAGIGIHTGYATCGFIGYEGRRDYAVVGNVTNLAARLSDAAAGGEILITAQVRNALGQDTRTEPAGNLELAGFSDPQPAFRLLDMPGAPRVAAGWDGVAPGAGRPTS